MSQNTLNLAQLVVFPLLALAVLIAAVVAIRNLLAGSRHPAMKGAWGCTPS